MDNKMISIIIPIRNEDKYISKCLDSVMYQTYPSELIEILVIDGMSQDNTRAIVKQYMEKGNNIRLIDNEKKIVPIAMNIGLKEAKGNIIIRLDGHSYTDEKFVEECVNKLNSTDADCVGGPLRTVSENTISKAIGLATSSPFGVGNSLSRYSDKEVYVDTVFFGAYRREVFDKIGVFDEELVRSQDSDLNYRIIKQGGKILLTPTIKIFCYNRSSLKKLWMQYYQYGFWKVKVIKKHKRPTALRQLIPFSFILSLGVSIIGSVFLDIFKYASLGIISSYLLLNLIFTTVSFVKNSKMSSIYLPMIFPILHLSYGLGFASGLFTFFISSKKSKITKNSKLSR